MATVSSTITQLKDFQSECVVVRWSPLTTPNADGAPFEMPGGADRSIQFTGGTFGAENNVVLEGSNDGVNYQTLRSTRQPDQQGDRLARTDFGDHSLHAAARDCWRWHDIFDSDSARAPGLSVRSLYASRRSIKMGMLWTTQRYL